MYSSAGYFVASDNSQKPVASRNSNHLHLRAPATDICGAYSKPGSFLEFSLATHSPNASNSSTPIASRLAAGVVQLSRGPGTLLDVANASNSLNIVPAAKFRVLGAFEAHPVVMKQLHSPGYGASRLQELRPQSSVSHAQAAMFDQPRVMGSCNSPPSRSPLPSKVASDSDDDIMDDHSRLSLIDSPNYIVKGAEVNGPESIPSIAPPSMFPPLTTLGKPIRSAMILIKQAREYLRRRREDGFRVKIQLSVIISIRASSIQETTDDERPSFLVAVGDHALAENARCRLFLEKNSGGLSQENFGQHPLMLGQNHEEARAPSLSQIKLLECSRRTPTSRHGEMRLAETKNMRAIGTRSWTVEEEGPLKRLIVAGSTWDTILEAMPDRTRSGVYSHIKTHLKADLTEATPTQGRASKSRPAKHFEESYLAPSKKHALTAAPTQQAPEKSRLRAPEMRVAQTSQESPDAGADLKAGTPATKQSRNINTNTQSPSKSETAKTESADLQLWVPKAALSNDPRISAYTSETFMDLNALGLALQQQWPTSRGFKAVIDQLQKVRDGSESEASLLILDTDFIATTRRVLEVAVGEFNSGKILLDSQVDNQCSTEELLERPDGRLLESYERKQSYRTLQKVYGSHDPAKCSNKKTPREIAEILKNAGVTKQSIILVWHTGYFDLTLLRELFESAGCDDILPPVKNCIPMTNHFRQGLPPRDQTGRMFTCRLHQLFPVLFAGHKLIGLSHNAAPDVQMLRLMVLLLIQLQRPLLKRGLDDFPKTTLEFVRDARPPNNFLDRRLGFSFTHHSE
ncbi:hypothetical protein PT974_04003 [Cladobotryum mycophilum]|uniref:Myb-like domain-containing protein n=1 Tax=Cladobotryum mycophilum TaxID=491253 RepID=A0ABR0STV0_9HYPO